MLSYQNAVAMEQSVFCLYKKDEKKRQNIIIRLTIIKANDILILSYSNKNETKNDKSVWTLMNYVQGGKNEKKENYCDFISISYGCQHGSTDCMGS